jgi:hypothetical protein
LIKSTFKRLRKSSPRYRPLCRRARA